METKYHSKYMTISIDRTKSYLETKRTTLTEYQNDEEYKTEILKWSEIIQNEKVEFQLVDERDMRYLVVPEIQNWINKVLIQPSIAVGVRKVAFLIAEDLFAQVAVKQIMGVTRDSPLQTKYFDNEKEAKKWLFTDELQNKAIL